jgi:hypothetical protein
MNTYEYKHTNYKEILQKKTPHEAHTKNADNPLLPYIPERSHKAFDFIPE